MDELNCKRLFDNAHDIISICDENAVPLHVNKSWKNIFGKKEDYKEVMSRIHPDDLEKVSNVWVRLVTKAERIENLTYRFKDRGGEYRYFETYANKMETSDSRKMFFTIARDITKRVNAERIQKDLELQLQQFQKMEAIGRLASGVAHDFNNILTCIIGNASLLIRNEPDNLELVEQLNDIKKAGERAAELTKQLLTYEQNQMLGLKPLSLNDTIRESIDYLKCTMMENIEIEMSLSDGFDRIMANQSHIDQVLMNILINAKDALPDGGKISICTSVVDSKKLENCPCLETNSEKCIHLEISDNGCGMDSETLDKIFEPFFTNKAKGKGTGLGLFTVYGIVQQLNACIYVSSSPGKGTKFQVNIPLLSE